MKRRACTWSPLGQRPGAVRRSSRAWRVMGRNFSRPRLAAASEWGSTAADGAAADALPVPFRFSDMVVATIAPLPHTPAGDAPPPRQEPYNVGDTMKQATDPR